MSEPASPGFRKKPTGLVPPICNSRTAYGEFVPAIANRKAALVIALRQ
jgi:hypothetical protein